MSTTISLQRVKARLLPPSPLENILEKIIELLPRRCSTVRMMPECDIKVLHESDGKYESIGKSPCFTLDISPVPQVGWYYLEAALIRHNGNREASIEIITSDQRIEISIPTNLRGSVREVFYLPDGAKQVYWRPTKAPGYFSQSSLLIHKISSLESFFRRAHRVMYDLWRFKSRASTSKAGLSLRGALFNLKDAYQRTAQLRLQRLTGSDYATFIELNDTLKKTNIRAMRKQAQQFRLRPVISLIIRMDNPDLAWFSEARNAISQQIYPEWELLLAGDLSSSPASLALAKIEQENDPRVRIIPCTGEANTAAHLNAALAHARGEYLIRLDQHDILPPHALYCLVQRLNQNPDAILIYTDHDVLDDAGKRESPCFKPDWNPDLLTSHNYLGSLCLYHTAWAKKHGGYRAGFTGAEDYDMALRCLKTTVAMHIQHIPRVLCHKHLEQHTAEISNEAHLAGKRVLMDYFAGTGASVEDGSASSLYRVRHPLPNQPPLVSIIVPTRDKLDILSACVESVRKKTDYPNWEILIVDNQSIETVTQGYLRDIQKDKRIRVIQYNHPFNYSAINNFAVKHANGEILALLNNDLEIITPSWLTEMVSHAVRPEVGAVGAKLLYINGTIQHAGVIIGLGGVAGHAHKYLNGDQHGYCYRAVVTQNLSAVTGACLVVKKSCYQQVGGLNEADLAIAFNDIDFCLKLDAIGCRNIFTPYALLYHHESISRGYSDTPEKHALFQQELAYMKNTWGEQLQYDAAYNPNLTLEFEDFSLSQQSGSKISLYEMV